MKKNHTKLYTGILIAIFFTVVATFFTYAKEENTINNLRNNAEKQIPLQSFPVPEKLAPIKETINTVETKPQQAETKGISQSVTVLAGGVTLKLPFSPPAIFYDALLQAKNEGKMQFSGKEYPGLGFFVTDIGTLHSGDRKDLLYYINGKEANVGVSSYILKDGDIVEWKLE